MGGSEVKMKKLTVSFIIIALNEEKTLPRLLNSIEQQSYNHKCIEIILVDSMSEDHTKSIMEEFARTSDFKRVACAENKKIIQASGWNVALKLVTSEVIIRLDAHAQLPADFVEKNIKLISEGQNICGGKVKNYILEPTSWQRVINMAEDSLFGGSIAAFRHKDTAGYVSTLAFATYKKEVFDTVGYFNEALVRTEDNEMHYRMRAAGYKFFYSPDIVSYRETRASLYKLIRQKFLNGYWIGRTLWICPQCFSIYHFIPLFFVLAIIFTAILAAFGVWQLAAVMWLCYFAMNIIMTIFAILVAKDNNTYCLCLPFIFLFLHVAYGIGTIKGLLRL